MQDETLRLAQALEAMLRAVVTEVFSKAAEEEALYQQGQKQQAAQIAAPDKTKAVKVKSRAELSKEIAKPFDITKTGVNVSAEDEGQTNNYQILFNRYGTALFKPSSAVRLFKNKLSDMEVIQMLLDLQKEGVAEYHGDNDWQMINIYPGKRR